MHSLLKKHPSKALQQAGEKYRKWNNSDLSNILQEKPRKYKTLSPEIQQKLHHMKSNIVDNLQMPEYVRELKNKRESLISDLHKKMLDNVLEIANHNNIIDLNENDVTIKDGKLYLCGAMFYWKLFNKEQRIKEYLKNPQNIIKDGHIKAFDSLIKITERLFWDKLKNYPIYRWLTVWSFPWYENESKDFCRELYKENEDFFKKMTSIISSIDLFDSEINSNDTKSMDICSIPLFVDLHDNVFYYDQYNRRWLSGIATNPYEIRSNMYEYEFLS